MAIALNGTTGISGVDGSASAPALQGTDSNTGINFASDTVNINTGGSTRYSVDSSGNIQAGGANPAFTGSSLASLSIKAPDGGSRYFFGEIGNSASAQLSLYDSSDSQKIRISAHSSDGTFHNTGTNLFIDSENSSGSNGRIYTNRGSDNATTLEINQNAGGSTEIITFRNSGSQLGTIHQSGSGVSYQSNSDYRLKENDVVISNGITRLKQLRPIRFNWKVDTETVVDGFYAHEVSAVVPEAVRGNKDEVFDTDGVGAQLKGGAKYQQLDQSKLIPLLTAALQEAIAKIEVLETKVAALEAG